MTQPVQEPTQGRTNQGLEWRTRQLFRRPAPPASAASVYSQNSVVRYSIGGPQWKQTDLFASYASGGSRVVDVTVPYGGYWDMGTVDGRYFCLGMPLGPQGSVWAITMAYRAASDAGRVVFDWQTTPVELVLGGVTFPQGIYSPEILSSTYYLPNSATVFDQDMYSAAPTDIITTGLFSPIMISGAGGDMLSAVGTAGSGAYGVVHREMNGGGDGSVIWWLRVRINGKNAASTNYHSRFYNISVSRLQGNYGIPLM